MDCENKENVLTILFSISCLRRMQFYLTMKQTKSHIMKKFKAFLPIYSSLQINEQASKQMCTTRPFMSKPIQSQKGEKATPLCRCSRTRRRGRQDSPRAARPHGVCRARTRTRSTPRHARALSPQAHGGKRRSARICRPTTHCRITS